MCNEQQQLIQSLSFYQVHIMYFANKPCPSLFVLVFCCVSRFTRIKVALMLITACRHIQKGVLYLLVAKSLLHANSMQLMLLGVGTHTHTNTNTHTHIHRQANLNKLDLITTFMLLIVTLQGFYICRCYGIRTNFRGM